MFQSSSSRNGDKTAEGIVWCSTPGVCVGGGGGRTYVCVLTCVSAHVKIMHSVCI